MEEARRGGTVGRLTIFPVMSSVPASKRESNPARSVMPLPRKAITIVSTYCRFLNPDRFLRLALFWRARRPAERRERSVE